MTIASLPTNFANAVSPFNPLGKQAVGEENVENKNSTIKPVEESSETYRGENRTGANEKAETPEQQQANKAKIDADGEQDSDSENPSSDEQSDGQEERREKQQEREAQEEISELSSRDREVRNHERAHTAVGGQYAGSPRYQYERGPDGVNYAVSGEVSISTGKIRDNPEATIAKAEQIRRAALAPADPSPQDRRVAATASQMEAEARRELVEAQQESVRAEKEAQMEKKAERAEEETEREQRNEELQQERASREASFAENNRLQRNFQQRLIDIGVEPIPAPVGSIISDTA